MLKNIAVTVPYKYSRICACEKTEEHVYLGLQGCVMLHYIFWQHKPQNLDLPQGLGEDKDEKGLESSRLGLLQPSICGPHRCAQDWVYRGPTPHLQREICNSMWEPCQSSSHSVNGWVQISKVIKEPRGGPACSLISFIFQKVCKSQDFTSNYCSPFYPVHFQ